MTSRRNSANHNEQLETDRHRMCDLRLCRCDRYTHSLVVEEKKMTDDFALTPPPGKKREHGPSKPMQRSLEHLRENHWICHIVEKFIPKREGMDFPRRIDAFGFGDILAMRPSLFIDEEGYVSTLSEDYNPLKIGAAKGRIVRGRIALVQTTAAAGGGYAEHRAKILELKTFPIWKRAGGLVFLHGWRWGKKPNGTKGWILREEEL